VIVLQNFKNVFQRFFRVLIHMHGGRIKYKKATLLMWSLSRWRPAQQGLFERSHKSRYESGADRCCLHIGGGSL
jgi:hypothetical protein